MAGGTSHDVEANGGCEVKSLKACDVHFGTRLRGSWGEAVAVDDSPSNTHSVSRGRMLRQSDVLSHSNTSCRSNLLFHPVI